MTPGTNPTACWFVQNARVSNLLIVEEAHKADDVKRSDELDAMRFSYPADHPLTAEFEEQMIRVLREYKGDGEYLSVHHPDEPDAKDDAPDATALMLFGAAGGGIGDILG